MFFERGKARVNVLIIAIIILAGSTLALGMPGEPITTLPSTNYIAITDAPMAKKDSLHFNSFKLVTPSSSPVPIAQATTQTFPTQPPFSQPTQSPTPTQPQSVYVTLPPSIPSGDVCDGTRLGGGKKVSPGQYACGCWLHVFVDDCGMCCDQVCRSASAAEGYTHPDAKYWCDAKPIIYLYPEIPTIVNVKLEVPGKVVISDPLYPENTGWQNILALPNGKFIYNGKQYQELFYEAAVTPSKKPEKGFIVKKEDIHNTLRMMTSKLGLNLWEQNEFLTFWVPKLQELNKPYIMLSVFDYETKRILDTVHITPKPDVFIEFIMYYKPLENYEEIEPLEFPEVPKRKGFTAVEWGGIIDYD